jgi:GAF domain-containing protein
MMSSANIATRHKSLLEVNRIALTTTTPENVFQGMCKVLKRVVLYDRAVLSVYDTDDDALRILKYCGPEESTFFRVGQLLSRDATQSGWTFEHKRALLRRNLAKEYRFPIDKIAIDEGYLSVCSVPLLVRGSSLGVVTVAAAKKNRLSVSDVEVVQQLSNQIALAVSAHFLNCPTHSGTKLLCPRCIGAAGGKTTVAKHRQNLSDWGRRGGRGRKSLAES